MRRADKKLFPQKSIYTIRAAHNQRTIQKINYIKEEKEMEKVILILLLGTCVLVSTIVWHFEYKKKRENLEDKLKIELLENELRHIKHILKNL
jgi:hypothetical protein